MVKLSEVSLESPMQQSSPRRLTIQAFNNPLSIIKTEAYTQPLRKQTSVSMAFNS